MKQPVTNEFDSIQFIFLSYCFVSQYFVLSPGNIEYNTFFKQKTIIKTVFFHTVMIYCSN